MSEIALPLAVCGYLAIALIWPTWSTWRRSGVWPVVFHRDAAPLQRAAGLVFVVMLLGLVGWSLRIGLGDPAERGVATVPAVIHGTGWLRWQACGWSWLWGRPSRCRCASRSFTCWHARAPSTGATQLGWGDSSPGGEGSGVRPGRRLNSTTPGPRRPRDETEPA